MLEWMPAKVFMGWQMFEAVEPFPAQRNDIATAIVASTIANANRGKNQRPFEIDDFMVKYEPEEVTEERERKKLANKINTVMFALGGVDKRGERKETPDG